MARKLRKLKIDRIDLVPMGANPDAYIVLYKAKDGQETHVLKQWESVTTKAAFDALQHSEKLSLFYDLATSGAISL